jgi:malonyl-CoA O-methyltransferase
MKKRVAARFSRAAESYEGAALAQAEVARACAAALPAGPSGLAVEIGAGGGLLTGLARARCAWSGYVGLDIAPGMLARLALRGPREVALVADGEAAPLRPGRADLLLSSSTMQWYRDPWRSIPANLELLAPGGAFALALFVEGTLAELARVSAETGFGSVLPLRPGREYADILARTPGVRFDWRELETAQTAPTVRAALDGLRRTGATATPAPRAHAPARWRAFARRYAELFAVPGGVRVSYRAVLLWGRREG